MFSFHMFNTSDRFPSFDLSKTQDRFAHLDMPINNMIIDHYEQNINKLNKLANKLKYPIELFPKIYNMTLNEVWRKSFLSYGILLTYRQTMWKETLGPDLKCCLEQALLDIKPLESVAEIDELQEIKKQILLQHHTTKPTPELWKTSHWKSLILYNFDIYYLRIMQEFFQLFQAYIKPDFNKRTPLLILSNFIKNLKEIRYNFVSNSGSSKDALMKMRVDIECAFENIKHNKIWLVRSECHAFFNEISTFSACCINQKNPPSLTSRKLSGNRKMTCKELGFTVYIPPLQPVEYLNRLDTLANLEQDTSSNELNGTLEDQQEHLQHAEHIISNLKDEPQSLQPAVINNAIEPVFFLKSLSIQHGGNTDFSIKAGIFIIGVIVTLLEHQDLTSFKGGGKTLMIIGGALVAERFFSKKNFHHIATFSEQENQLERINGARERPGA